MANAKKAPRIVPKAAPLATDPISRYFEAYWQGRMPLWGAFWVWGMGVGTLVGLLFTIISLPLLGQFSMLYYTENDPFLLALNVYLLLVMYGFWLTFYTWHTVSVWRCAEHAPTSAKWPARLFVLAVTLTFWPVYILNVFIRFL